MKILRILTSTAALVLLSSTSALAQKFDGTYSGLGSVLPSYNCYAEGYQTKLTIRGNQFETETIRVGGQASGSVIKRVGFVDSDGVLTQSADNLPSGIRKFFWAKVVGDEIVGTYGGSNGSISSPRERMKLKLTIDVGTS